MALPADHHVLVDERREASPANFLIEIQPFSLFSASKFEFYESMPFEAGGYKWKMTIYPDGDVIEDEDEDEGSHVSAYLSVVSGIGSQLPVDWEVTAIFTFFLYNQISDTYLCFQGKPRRYQELSNFWGSSKMISKEMLNDPKYIIDDKCVFGAEVYVIKPQPRQSRAIESLSLPEDIEPYKRQWEISELSKLQEDDVWMSEEFRTGGHQWRIELYPEGYGMCDDRYVSVFLALVDDPDSELESGTVTYESVKVDGCFRIRNHSRNFSCWYKPDEKFGGFVEFIKSEEIRDPSKGFVGTILLEVEFSVLAVGTGSAPAHSQSLNASSAHSQSLNLSLHL